MKRTSAKQPNTQGAPLIVAALPAALPDLAVAPCIPVAYAPRAVAPTKGGRKLTPEIVGIIKANLAAGVAGNVLAALYGIHESDVSRIKRGTRWLEVPPADPKKAKENNQDDK